MTVYLDNQSSAYMAALHVDTGNAGDLQAARAKDLAKLDNALHSSDPIDAELVHFLIDSHNDTPADIAAFKSFLYGNGAAGSGSIGYYLWTQKRPITEALAPLFLDTKFIDADSRDDNIAKGLFTGRTATGGLATPPPASVIEVLAKTTTPIAGDGATQRTGTELASLRASDYIKYAVDHDLPLRQDLIDAYIAIDPAAATPFIGNLLLNNVDRTDLMDAYQGLNPNGASGSPVTLASLKAAPYLLDPGFNIAIPGTPPTLGGWTLMAMKSLMDDARQGKAVNTALLDKLTQTQPDGGFAAAWVSWDTLSKQAHDPALPRLEQKYWDNLQAFSTVAITTLADNFFLYGLISPGLIDNYRAVNPNGPHSPIPLASLNLDNGFDALIPGAAPSVGGWAVMAMKQIKDDAAAGKPVNTTLLTKLTETSPYAAAWVSWDILREQSADPELPTLDPALLSNLDDFDKAAMLGVELTRTQTPSKNMDLYRQLNPMGARGSPIPGGTLGLDIGFKNFPGTGTAPAIGGWAVLAMKSLHDSMAAGRPLDTNLLAQLKDVSAYAAAWVSWDILVEQSNNPAYPSLHPALLETLGSFSRDALVWMCESQLGKRLQPTNALFSDTGTAGDNVTSSGLVTVDLLGMGVTPKVGDKLFLNVNGTPNGQAAGSYTYATNPAYTLTQDDISRGTVVMATTAGNLLDGTYTATSKILSGLTVSVASTPLTFTVDKTAPAANWAASSSYLYASGGALYGTISVPDSLDGSYGKAYYKAGTVWTEIADTTVDAVNQRLNFKLPAGVTSPVSITYRARDQAGNMGGEGDEHVLATNASPTYTSGLAKSSLPLAVAPKAALLDHFAYEALKAVDPAGAQSWYARFQDAGLVGPVPPPPPLPPPAPPPPPVGPPPPPPPPGESPEELMEFDLETLLWKVYTYRAQEVEDQLKAQISVTQAKNEMMGKLNSLLGAMNEMAARIPSSTAEGLGIKDVFTSEPAKSDMVGLGNKINAAIAQVPGLSVFSENNPSGTLDPSKVTKAGLTGAINQIRSQLDSLGNNQQTEMLRLQSLTTKRNECFNILTNHMDKVSSVRERIIDNTR